MPIQAAESHHRRGRELRDLPDAGHNSYSGEAVKIQARWSKLINEIVSPETPSTQSPPGMLWIPGGTFLMGSEDFYPEEGPIHEVSVDGFWMDRCVVTNEKFALFVQATGYVTVAERALNPADYPGAPIENLVPGALVFHKTQGPVDLTDYTNWWVWAPGTSWRHPFGPHSSIDGIEQHPVVHIAYEDAEAYARWSGKRIANRGRVGASRPGRPGREEIHLGR